MVIKRWLDLKNIDIMSILPGVDSNSRPICTPFWLFFFRIFSHIAIKNVEI